MLLTYFLNDYEIIPIAPIITGITLVFTIHIIIIIIIIIIVIIIIIPFTSTSSEFTSYFPNSFHTQFKFFSCTLHVSPTSLSLIWWPLQ